MGTSGYGEHVSVGHKIEAEPKCTHLILFHVWFVSDKQSEN